MDEKGEVLITIMASLAQQESELLSKNTKMGIQYRFQQGKVLVNPAAFLIITNSVVRDFSGLSVKQSATVF